MVPAKRTKVFASDERRDFSPFNKKSLSTSRRFFAHTPIKEAYDPKRREFLVWGWGVVS